MLPTPDGGYIAGGSTWSGASGDKSQPSQGNRDYWVIKLNAQGQPQWDRTYGGDQFDDLHDLQVTRDGGYLLAGTSTSGTSGDKTHPSQGGADYWIVKLNAAGEKQWDRTIGGPGGDDLNCLRQLPDGSYLLAGTSASAVGGNKTQPNRGDADYWVVKLDEQGQQQWDRTYGSVKGDLLVSAGLTLTRDGGCLIGGFSAQGASADKRQPGWGRDDYWVLKLDANGNKQWDGTFGGEQDDRLVGVHQTPDGGYLLSGFSASGREGTKTQPRYDPITPGASIGYDYWVVKLNAAGGVEWDRTIGTPQSDELRAAELTADGGIILGGSTFAGIAGDKTTRNNGLADYWIVKLSALGVKEWDLDVGSHERDGLASIQPTPEGGYIVGGDSWGAPSGDRTQPGRGLTDFWLVKVGAPLVQITGDTRLCNGGQLPLTAVSVPTGATYQWDTGATSATITVTQAGTYHVTATFANGARSTTSHQVSVLTPAMRIQGDSLLCPGSALRLTAVGTAATVYRWSTGETTPSILVNAPGRYRVTAQYGAGCSLTQEVVVRNPTLQLQGSPWLCGNDTQLEAVAPGAITYRWSTGATTATLAATQAGTYSVVATFANGCTRTAAVQVRAPVVTIQGDSVLCGGQPLLLTAQSNLAATYRWNTGATGATIRVQQPGTYTLTAFYATGCQRSTTWRVVTAPVLPAFRAGTDTTVCEGTTLQLRAPLLQAPVSYRWSDGSTEPTLRVQQAGTYSVVVQTPCEQRTFMQHVQYKSCLLLPNIVTANGDGLNDTFAPKGLLGTGWELTVYNRWGRQVYTSKAYTNEWGSEAAGGVYYYLLSQPASGVHYRGFVEVVR
ncbi:hypothetical protein BXP70_25900 [Hymenobacter crusticola]|uniref:Ig-like domain-containing protein n=1 Tax=Hymenobacter crusticola TaxID=1770526 RepID=A0A243W8R0_9BACT|nr:hypothetical protein BXP70_25900 [Hymenobacter crusticola]